MIASGNANLTRAHRTSPAQTGAGETVDGWYVPAAPNVDRDRVLRIQGYPDLSRVRPVIRRAAEAMAATASALSEPAIAHCIVRVESLSEDELLLEGSVRLHCMAFGRQLKGCTEIAPFVLGVGEAIPRRVQELAESGDLLEAVLLEAAGWLAIEDATRQFKTWLRETSLKRECRITSRMGPGYSYKIGDKMHMWRLEEQAALFGLFGGSKLPATLMESCAMSPKMSRSGFYGIAPLQSPTNRIRAGEPAVATSN